MQKQTAHEGEVEFSDDLGRQLVHRKIASLHARSESLVSDAEVAERGAPAFLPPSSARTSRPIVVGLVIHVDGHDLSRSPSLHLEGPESLGGTHVQAALALERDWKWHPSELGERVEVAGRDDSAR